MFSSADLRDDCDGSSPDAAIVRSVFDGPRVSLRIRAFGCRKQPGRRVRFGPRHRRRAGCQSPVERPPSTQSRLEARRRSRHCRPHGSCYEGRRCLSFSPLLYTLLIGMTGRLGGRTLRRPEQVP
jgi:hypothetical protein